MGGFGNFRDPIIGGLGKLIRDVIQSINFVAGVSGWAIFKDGSYEFGPGGTFRGDLSVTSPSGSEVDIIADPDSAQILLQPPNSTTPGVTFGPSQIGTTSVDSDASLYITGPSLNTPISTPFAEIVITHDGVNNLNYISFLSDAIDFNSTIRNTSALSDMGKGLWAYAGSTADSAANTAEQIVLTIGSTTYKAGRVYRVDVTGRIAPAAAAQPLMQVRKTNLAGVIEMVLGRVTCAAAQEYAPPSSVYFQVGGSDITTVLVLTLDGGGVSTRHESSNVGRTFTIWDVCDATKMPDVVTLT